jgi:UPF0716 family protein affecting phage T7 exclusion
VELMATMAGAPLYRACGYQELERVTSRTPRGDVPQIRMGKSLAALRARP